MYWSINGTLAFYDKHCGISLVPLLSVLMWDATLAGAAAHNKRRYITLVMHVIFATKFQRQKKQLRSSAWAIQKPKVLRLGW